MERQRSPSYPSLSLPQAIEMIEKLHKSNRTSVISRETAAKDMGYAGLTGRSLTVLAALAQYGLIERTGKGDIKVSRRAVDILHSIDNADRAEAIREAAFAPKLFMQLHERFPEGVPSHNALRSYLIKQEFADVAIGHAITAFLETNAFVENTKESESHGIASHDGSESLKPDEVKPKFGGAHVGDIIQWESGGVLQLEKPTRVRLVSADGQYVAVDGNETGIPMDQVIVEQRAPAGKSQTPMFPIGLEEAPRHEKPTLAGETEWMRLSLGRDTKARLLVTGTMGPKEIGRLIKMLDAQKDVLDDEAVEYGEPQPFAGSSLERRMEESERKRREAE